MFQLSDSMIEEIKQQLLPDDQLLLDTLYTTNKGCGGGCVSCTNDCDGNA